ncbi:DUF3564 family protein [Paraburkholderia oxyphila]|uniref:DUF3564 family protein n=1 Tax=Paraburkholderia oxyphila TaxID=614212 RepID=UPI0004826645|nr:DUF3564 family protein [Paraburkholderia oxyphila]
MRITLHLDTFDRLAPGAYGIVWIDKETGKWSREGHAGLALPQWGRYRSGQGCTWLIAGVDGAGLCTLEGLDLAAHDGPFEGEHGRVQWHGGTQEPATGDWHVQCVDETACDPEDAFFADEA